MDKGSETNENSFAEDPIFKGYLQYLEATKEYNEKVDRGEIVPTAPEDMKLVWVECEMEDNQELYIDGCNTRLMKKYGRLTVKNPEFLKWRGYRYQIDGRYTHIRVREIHNGVVSVFDDGYAKNVLDEDEIIDQYARLDYEQSEGDELIILTPRSDMTNDYSELAYEHVCLYAEVTGITKQEALDVLENYHPRVADICFGVQVRQNEIELLLPEDAVREFNRFGEKYGSRYSVGGIGLEELYSRVATDENVDISSVREIYIKKFRALAELPDGPYDVPVWHYFQTRLVTAYAMEALGRDNVDVIEFDAGYNLDTLRDRINSSAAHDVFVMEAEGYFWLFGYKSMVPPIRRFFEALDKERRIFFFNDTGENGVDADCIDLKYDTFCDDDWDE